jgi:acetyl esterase/lipase
MDAADRESARPDFAIAVYPGHLFDYKKGGLFSDINVTSNTPPTFLLHAENDNVDGPSNTLSYYAALKNAKVPVELHMYAQGRTAANELSDYRMASVGGNMAADDRHRVASMSKRLRCDVTDPTYRRE